MKVAFVRDNTLLSFLIRAFTWSRYHHCGAVTECGEYIIEASPFIGVAKTPIKVFEAKYKTIHYSNIPCDNKKAFDYLASRMGNKYDWLAVFGIVLKFMGQDRNKDYCSELLANASGVFRKERTSRITPEILWMITK